MSDQYGFAVRADGFDDTRHAREDGSFEGLATRTGRETAGEIGRLDVAVARSKCADQLQGGV